MHSSGLSTMSVPQATGHPFGLPDPKIDRFPDRKVRPVVGVRDPETERWSGPPSRFWRTANGGPDPATHVAPPSIMQIRISQMLEAQVAAKDEAQPAASDARQPPDRNADPLDNTMAAQSERSAKTACPVKKSAGAASGAVPPACARIAYDETTRRTVSSEPTADS